jgi:diguanylate cyclase (GGDEF)-like protein/PAS domain S-box-containing protein
VTGQRSPSGEGRPGPRPSPVPPELERVRMAADGILGRGGQASYEELRAIVELAPVGIGIVDLEGRTILTNDALRRMLGYSTEQFATLHWSAFTHPEDVARNLELFAEMVAGRSDHFEMDKRFVAADGSTVWGRLTVSLLRDEAGAPALAIGMTENITERRRLGEQLRAAEASFRLLVEESPGVVYVAQLDLTLPWRYVSPRLEKLLGITAAEWLEQPSLWWTEMDDRDRPDIERQLGAITADRDPGPHVLHYRMRRRDGAVRWIRDEFRVVEDADGASVFRGVLIDVTREKELEEGLERQATHDPLTGLANRELFTQRVADRLATPSGPDRHHAVILVDLDDFKTVNDSLGHAAGDELIRSVAERIEGSLRPGDLAARLGGDEFVLLVEDLADPVAAVVIASRLQEAIGEPHELGVTTVTTSASLGIAFLEDAGSVEVVLRNADLAMYRAKHLGKGRVAAYEASLHDAAVRRLNIRSALEGSVERGEMQLYLQPIVDLDTLEIVAAEALLRWDHPVHGRVPPEDFIPVAEETGIINELGSWVLGEAGRWLAEQHAAGRTALSVEINVSPVQLEEDSFVEAVEHALAETGLPPERLVLEITEQALMSPRSWFELDKLDRLGVAIAVDDFGTGYASLAYLSGLATDALKIDKQFVAQLTGEPRGRAVPNAIVQLARSLDLEVIAEGIETSTQWDELRALGCRAGQGYLFARPMPAAAMTRLLERRLTLSPITLVPVES